MSEMTTTTICLGQIKQESEFDLNDDLKPILKLELPPEQYPNITDNPVACNTCKQEIDVEHQFDTIFMKEEIKEELVEDGINTEDLVDDDSILFNTDIPLVKKTYSEGAVQILLPEKSKSRYEKAYRDYKDWCAIKNVNQKTSENIVFDYITELAQSKKPSTLWATYSMLRSTLEVNENIDISKFSKLLAYLKKQNLGYKPKKSSTFSRNEIDKFLKDAPLDFIPQKVALILGTSGACRSDELSKMTVADINFLDDKVCVSIPDTKTHSSRVFMVSNPEWITILKQYINMRANIDNNRLFMQVRYNKITKQPFGHNTIASFPKKIATYLKLDEPETFTGHCFRRTATTLLDQKKVAVTLSSATRDCGPSSSNEFSA